MALESLTKETIKGYALNELQGLTCAVVAGTTAATNIAITGLKTTDTILAVIHEDGTTGVTQANLVAEASIPTAGNLQLSTTDTSTDVLIVWYYVKPVK